MWILVTQRILIEFVLDLLYFPLWYFTGGIRRAFVFCIGLIRDANNMMAPGLWLKNIFVPMFGQWDLQGRLMSFFMRLVNVIGRSIGLLVWTVVVLVMFVLWLAFPFLVFYMIFISL